ncbi:MAG TPA: hypothetical protein VHK68_08695 [Gemmatimonadales bacterium]|nr:hypothetical protein [Gemmatimonadales bacterium]
MIGLGEIWVIVDNDLLDNRQGEIARLVAGTLGAVALRPPRDGLVVDSRVMSRDSTP